MLLNYILLLHMGAWEVGVPFCWLTVHLAPMYHSLHLLRSHLLWAIVELDTCFIHKLQACICYCAIFITRKEHLVLHHQQCNLFLQFYPPFQERKQGSSTTESLALTSPSLKPGVIRQGLEQAWAAEENPGQLRGKCTQGRWGRGGWMVVVWWREWKNILANKQHPVSSRLILSGQATAPVSLYLAGFHRSSAPYYHLN